jgi:hypothetical protein
VVRHDRDDPDRDQRDGEVQKDESAARATLDSAPGDVVELAGGEAGVRDEDLGADDRDREPDEDDLTRRRREGSDRLGRW